MGSTSARLSPLARLSLGALTQALCPARARYGRPATTLICTDDRPGLARRTALAEAGPRRIQRGVQRNLILARSPILISAPTATDPGSRSGDTHGVIHRPPDVPRETSACSTECMRPVYPPDLMVTADAYAHTLCGPPCACSMRITDAHGLQHWCSSTASVHRRGHGLQ